MYKDRDDLGRRRAVASVTPYPASRGSVGINDVVSSNQAAATEVSCLSLGADTFDAVGC